MIGIQSGKYLGAKQMFLLLYFSYICVKIVKWQGSRLTALKATLRNL